MGFNISNVKSSAVKIGLKLWKHRSDIAFVVGTAGTITGTVLFVKASKKNAPAVEKYKNKKAEIESRKDTEDEEIVKKETKDNTLMIIKESVKNYALPTVVSVTGYALQTFAHVEMRSDLTKANTALAASVAAMEAIKDRIVKAEGEDKWREYAYGQSVSSVVETDENGNFVEHKEVNLGSGNVDFSVEYDESAATYDEYKNANKDTLMLLENAWQDKLNVSKEIVWLRNVWNSIFGDTEKFPKEWANAGWIPDCNDPAHDHISFGIRPEAGKEQDEATKLFWKGEVPNVRLVFNCYYDIYNI